MADSILRLANETPSVAQKALSPNTGKFCRRDFTPTARQVGHARASQFVGGASHPGYSCHIVLSAQPRAS